MGRLKNSCALVTWRRTGPPARDVRTIERHSPHTVNSNSVSISEVSREVGDLPPLSTFYHYLYTNGTLKCPDQRLLAA